MEKKLDYSRYYFPLVLLLSALCFINLGFAEMQPWDEGLYALRVKSILLFGDWLDQTAHASGGLYSSAHPPLFIWLNVLAVKLLGENLIAFRIWSAIFGALTIILVYFFPKDRKEGLISAAIIALLPYYIFYARQGQLDITVTFFIFLGIFAWKKYEDKNSYKWMVISGVAFGLALMTKIIVGFFLPISIFIYLVYKIVRKQAYIKSSLIAFSIFLATGLILAAPWHIYMLVAHGKDFINYYFFFHIINRMSTGVEANIRALGVLYYINQLAVIFSATAAGFAVKRINFKKPDHNLLVFISFAVPFLIFTVSKTKMATYTLPMIPPLALLAGSGLYKMVIANEFKRMATTLALIFGFWSFSQDFRNFIKHTGLHFISYEIILLTLLVIILTFLIIYYSKKIKPVYILSLVFVIMAARFILIPPKEYYYTGIDYAAKAAGNNFKNLYYFDIHRNSMALNPQMSYYFGGVDLGWQKDKYFHRINDRRIDCYSNVPIQSNSLYIVNNMECKFCFSGFEEVLRKKSRVLLYNRFYHVYKVD